MHKQGKKFLAAAKQVEQRPYQLNDAVPLVQKIKFAKFDETIELHMRLGVDPKHADQMVRGTVVLPNGLGKSKKVLVIASGGKQREAEAAGADFVGGEEMVEKIQKENWTDFDALISTPDMSASKSVQFSFWIFSTISSPPTKSAPAASASRCFPPLAMTKTFFDLPS